MGMVPILPKPPPGNLTMEERRQHVLFVFESMLGQTIGNPLAGRLRQRIAVRIRALRRDDHEKAMRTIMETEQKFGRRPWWRRIFSEPDHSWLNN